MSLYDMIMGEAITKQMWSELGQGLINDEDLIKRILEAGYEGIEDD